MRLFWTNEADTESCSAELKLSSILTVKFMFLGYFAALRISIGLLLLTIFWYSLLYCLGTDL